MPKIPPNFVKTCRKLESGLRFGQEGIRACQNGQFASPIYWTAEEAKDLQITKKMIEEKRRWLFNLLNSDDADITCKRCHMVELRPQEEIDFSHLGHIDFAPNSLCNLRCTYCGYTKNNAFFDSKFDALAILRNYSKDDVLWDAAVDFNGGEPSLFKDLDEHLDFFAANGIRVLLYTNTVRYRQSIYDGLANGTIRWVCTSLDAGSPSSFKRLKQKDRFADVLENLARYADAGSKGGGMLAVKYIFCEDNCTDDDITGFAYAMLAIRPQKIWLTFDFEPLFGLPNHVEDFGGYDYTKHVQAYAKLYWLLKKHGLEPVHYNDTHLSAYSSQGKLIMDWVRQEITRIAPENIVNPNSLQLADFRQSPTRPVGDVELFSIDPVKFASDEQGNEGTLRGKRVMLVPTSAATRRLLSIPEIQEADIVAFIDRDRMLWGREVDGVPIYGYQAITDMKPDLVLVVPPDQHQAEILSSVSEHCPDGTRVLRLASRTA